MSEWKPIEIWRDIDGWEGRYRVSSFGRVCGLHGVLSPWPNDQGYLYVRLSGPRKMLRVHRAVAVAFIPNPEQRPDVNHLDCVRSNNRVDNLEWCTPLENLRYADQLGRMQKDYWVGRRPPSATLSDSAVRQMREMYLTGKWSWESIGRAFGVSKRCAGRAIKGDTYADVR